MGLDMVEERIHSDDEDDILKIPGSPKLKDRNFDSRVNNSEYTHKDSENFRST